MQRIILPKRLKRKLISEKSSSHLSEQYYKARKQLALYSGLLFAWEFIGIDVPSDPFPNLSIHIKNPQAVPIVLIVLILYFGFRTMLEWYQSAPDRRKFKASKIDFKLTIRLPSIALITFVIQRLLEIEIFDYISKSYESKKAHYLFMSYRLVPSPSC
jgi:hypothetical protein